MKAIGIIIGHGYGKVVSGNATAVFPAVAAQAVAGDFETLLGGGAKAIRLNGAGDWVVGHDALIFAPGRLVSILDRARYRSPSFVALARHALAQVAGDAPGPLAILTGMPAAWFADKDARSALEAAMRAAAAPWGDGCRVTVAPEPAGVYYAHVFAGGTLDTTRTQGAVGVIDAGYRDIGVALFVDGRYVGGESVPGGAVEGLREIKRLIAQTYRLELSPHEVDAAVRAGGLMVDGTRRPLPDGTARALLRGLDPALAAGRSLWPNGGRSLRALVLGGGGAHALGAKLREEFPEQLVVLDAPQLAGAVGFAAAAAAQIARGA
jgi:hypothetical protein